MGDRSYADKVAIRRGLFLSKKWTHFNVSNWVSADCEQISFLALHRSHGTIWCLFTLCIEKPPKVSFWKRLDKKRVFLELMSTAVKRRVQNSNELLSVMNADKYNLETRESFGQRQHILKTATRARWKSRWPSSKKKKTFWNGKETVS